MRVVQQVEGIIEVALRSALVHRLPLAAAGVCVARQKRLPTRALRGTSDPLLPVRPQGPCGALRPMPRKQRNQWRVLAQYKLCLLESEPLE